MALRPGHELAESCAMKRIKFIDTTVRDGQQSLWATRMRNHMFLPYLPEMDRIGFDWIDLVGGAVFDVCVRYLCENPWERMRLAAERCPRTPLNVWTRGQSLFTFEFFPDDIVDLTIRHCAASGIKRYTCYDALNDIRNIELSIRTGKDVGLFISGQVVYTVSPVHTDTYYSRKAREIVALGVDSIGLKDPSGLLTPERVTTLLPALREAAGNVPLEVHTHCRSGLGELSLVDSVKLGADIVHTGVRPLASSDALPEVGFVAGRLRELGYQVDLDDAGLARMEAYFNRVAQDNDMPVGVPRRYDPFLYEHQVPGGMISNLRSQLRDLQMEHRLGEVLEEAVHVREDLGYPILVSPFAQFVITQAVINVVQGERYATIPDEIARYVMGYYGEIAGEVAPKILDRVASTSGINNPVHERPGALVPPRIEKLKAERGPFKSNGDLLLAAYYSSSQLAPLVVRGSSELHEGRTPEDLKSVLKEARPSARGRITVKRADLVFEGAV
jgi:oxaloacetate decarboxylase (Na+ extruding) subunit alpha